jgi:hypothetical protein
VTSRAYQASGRLLPGNREDRLNYSHAQPRPLDAEVLLDAISDVTGVPEVFATAVSVSAKVTAQAPIGTRAIQLGEPDVFYSRFLEVYGRPNRQTLPERSGHANLAEAMHMLAGTAYNEKLGNAAGRLQRLLKTGKTNAQIVEEIYLAAFARYPEEAETAGIQDLIAAGPDREAALKEFVWAVLCSREFAENH